MKSDVFLDSNQAVSLVISKLIKWSQVLISHIPNFILAVLIILCFLGVSRFTTKYLKRKIKSSYLNLPLQSLILALARFTILCAGFFFALSILGLDKLVLSLLAGVGIIGIALGFAFRDLAANIISGIFMAINEPAKYGDWISIKEFSGTLVQINLRDMVIRTGDGEIVRIPNKDYMAGAIRNLNSYGQRRVIVEFEISVQDDFNQIQSMLLQSLLDCEEILQDPAPNIVFEGFIENRMRYKLQAWIQYPETSFLEVKKKLAHFIKDLKVKKIITPIYFKKCCTSSAEQSK